MAWRVYAKDAISGQAVPALTSNAATPEAAAEEARARGLRVVRIEEVGAETTSPPDAAEFRRLIAVLYVLAAIVGFTGGLAIVILGSDGESVGLVLLGAVVVVAVTLVPVIAAELLRLGIAIERNTRAER